MKKLFIIIVMLFVTLQIVNSMQREITTIYSKTATMTGSSSATYTTNALEIGDADSIVFNFEVTSHTAATCDSLTMYAKFVPLGYNGDTDVGVTTHAQWIALTSVLTKSSACFHTAYGSYVIPTAGVLKYQLIIIVTNANANSETNTWKVIRTRYKD